MFKFVKVLKVKDPVRAEGGNAGIDFFVPSNQEPTFLNPGQSATISLGIHCKIEENKALVFFNKSGVAVKRNLLVGACVIDECYQGEIHLNLHNVCDRQIRILPDEKIIQGLLLDVDYSIPENSFKYIPMKSDGPKGEFSDKIIAKKLKSLYTEVSIRGEGKFGSTDKDDKKVNLGPAEVLKTKPIDELLNSKTIKGEEVVDDTIKD